MTKIPAIARWCALIAVINATVWSVVTPPFHVPDETGHVAYVQYLAETGKVLNRPGKSPFSEEQARTMETLLFSAVVGRPADRPIEDSAGQKVLDATRSAKLDRSGEGGTIESSQQPPLYYGMEAVVYRISPFTDLVSRMWVMRLFSALLAGATALFCVLFIREFVSSGWAQATGGLAVAFQPLLGFASSGVTPDSLLYAASAATFYLLARAFSRGMTPKLGLAIGVALAVGTTSKLNYAALLPGALVGLALLAWRARGAGLRSALLGVGAAVGVLAGAVVAVVGLNVLLWDRSTWGGGVGAAATVATSSQSAKSPVTLSQQLSYTWQLYLPRLPFMAKQFVYFPPWQVWFRGWIGNFGWLDTQFPAWVYRLGLGVATPVAGLAVVEAFRRRLGFRGRLAELLTFALMIGGLLASIGILGLSYRNNTGYIFEQARYLLPLLPFYGLLVAKAAKGAGTRYGRYVAAVIVVLAASHGLFSQLLVISRFYG